MDHSFNHAFVLGVVRRNAMANPRCYSVRLLRAAYWRGCRSWKVCFKPFDVFSDSRQKELECHCLGAVGSNIGIQTDSGNTGGSHPARPESSQPETKTSKHGNLSIPCLPPTIMRYVLLSPLQPSRALEVTMPGLETGDLSARATMRRWARGTVSFPERLGACTSPIALLHLRRGSGQLTDGISRWNRNPWD